MEFIKYLRESYESRKSRAEMNSAYMKMGYGSPVMQIRMLQSFVNTKGYRLSIQASEAHYCTPREFLPLDKYTAMEIAVMDPEGNFVQIADVTNNQAIIEKFAEYEGDSVYGYIPVELIEELYQDSFND